MRLQKACLFDVFISAGLARLVAARKQLAMSGRSLEVIAVQGQQPDRVLRTGRFDTIMAVRYCDL